MTDEQRTEIALVEIGYILANLVRVCIDSTDHIGANDRVFYHAEINKSIEDLNKIALDLNKEIGNGSC